MRVFSNIAHIVGEGGHWLLFGHALTVLGQFALIKLLAMMTDQQLFGQFSIIMLIVAALTTLIYGPLTQWFLRHASHLGEEGRGDTVLAVMNLAFVVPALVIIAPVLLVILSMPEQGLVKEYLAGIPLVGAVAFAVCTSLNNLCSVMINTASHPRAASMFYIAASWSRVLVVAMVLSVFEMTISTIVQALLVGQLVVLVVQYIYIRTRVLTTSTTVSSYASIDHRGMLRYITPFLLWGVPAYVAMTADRWIVSHYVSIEEFAQYAAMVFVTFSIINAFNVGYERATGPIIFRMSGDGSERGRIDKAGSLVTDLLLILAAIYLSAVLVYYIAPDLVLGLLTSDEYTSYSGALWLMMLSASFFGAAQFIVARGLVVKKPGMYVVPKFIHSIIIVLMLALLVPSHGVEGAVLSVLAANIIYLVMVVLTNNRLKRHGRRGEAC